MLGKKLSFIIIALFCILLLNGCGFKDPNNYLQSDNNVTNHTDTDVQKGNFDNEKYFVFVRDIVDRRPSENFAEGYDLYNQIVIKNNDTNEERVIVNAGKITDLNIKNIDGFPVDVLVNLSNPVFSLDGGKVFFNAIAWMTSLATFSYDVNTGDLSYLTHGSIKEIVKEGKNAGHLILIQRKHIEDQPVMYCEFIVDENSGDIIEDLNICL